MAKHLNRQQHRELNSKLHKRKSVVKQEGNDEAQRLFKEVHDTCGWLQGNMVKLAGGAKVDFAMMDYALAAAKYTTDDMKDGYSMVRRFWITLFPHISAVLDKEKMYNRRFRELENIADRTITKFSEQNFELQYRQKFMEQFPDIEKKFKAFHKQKKKETAAEIEKIKARENELRKHREEQKKGNKSVLQRAKELLK